MACGNKSPYKTWEEHYSDAWSRGMGAQSKTLKLVFDGGVDHVDGAMLKIARLMPINFYTDIKVRTEGLPGVKFDLGCVGHSTDCKGEKQHVDLTYFAKEMDVDAKVCGTLNCGPWDCRGSGCAPECCEDTATPACADPVHVAEPHDLVLTLHGKPPECGTMWLTFEYTNSN